MTLRDTRHHVPVPANIDDTPTRCKCPVCRREFAAPWKDVKHITERVDNDKGTRSCYVYLCDEHRHMAQDVLYKAPPPLKDDSLRAFLERGRGHINADPETAKAEILYVIASVLLDLSEAENKRNRQ